MRALMLESSFVELSSFSLPSVFAYRFGRIARSMMGCSCRLIIDGRLTCVVLFGVNRYVASGVAGCAVG